MAEASRGRKSGSTTPPEHSTTPPSNNLSAGDLSYVETVTEIHRTLGRLEQAVETLTAESTAARNKLDRLSHVVYAATVVVTIIGIILGIIANKVGDAIVVALKSAGH